MKLDGLAKLFNRVTADFGAPALWQSSVPQLVLMAKRQAELYHSTAVRQMQRELHHLFDSDPRDLMVRMFSESHPRSLQHWLKGDNNGLRYMNVVKTIVETLAVMYHRPPEFWLERDGERLPPEHPESVQWRADIADGGIAASLQTLDTWTCLFRTTLCQPAWVHGRVQWLVHAPYLYAVFQDPDDPASVETAPLVSIELPQLVDTVGHSRPSHFMSWVQDADGWRCYMHDAGGRMFINPLFPDNVNGYGLQPFTVWRPYEPAPGEFFLPPDEVLWAFQRNVNAQLTWLDFALRYQAAAVPVFTNAAGEKADPTLSPAEPLVLISDRADFKFAQPQPNIKQLEDAIENALRWEAVSRGLPPDTWSKDGATRNLAAKKMEAAALEMQRERRRPFYDVALRRTFEVHKVVGNYHAAETGRTRYSADTRLGYELASVPVPVDTFQETQANVSRFRDGTWSPVDQIQRERGCTKSEARRIWERNLEDAKMLPPTHPGSQASPAAGGTQRPPDVQASSA